MTDDIRCLYQLMARPVDRSATGQNGQVWQRATESGESLQLETLTPETLAPETLEPETLAPERLS
jgi:hypothetical protein